MNCSLCGNKMVDDYTAFTVLKENAVYVTEDVPCLKCTVCEHVVFTQKVAKKLERYSSGRTVPMMTYRSWVFRWGEPIVEIPKLVYPPVSNERVSISVSGTAGILVS